MKDIIHKYKEGLRINEIAHELEKASSTIATILKKKEEIKVFDVAKGITMITPKKKQPEIMNEVERLLL